MIPLNEGRGVNPGDTAPDGDSSAPLNEGRGVNPGDTGNSFGRVAWTRSPLNEGRGVNPGDTAPESADYDDVRHHPLNEGRGVNPGDTRRLPRKAGRWGWALNEGRGVNPGDTRQIVDAHMRSTHRSTKAEV